jgi:hypothetical protein
MYVPEKCLSFINIRIKVTINVCEYVWIIIILHSFLSNQRGFQKVFTLMHRIYIYVLLNRFFLDKCIF